MAKDYKAIAAKKIRKPGTRPPRVLVYARNKKGKTHFGASAPKVLIIDPESGAEAVNPESDIWPVNTWTDLDEVYNYLKTEEASEKYEWVCVDGLTRLNNMALRHVMKMAEERDLERTPGLVDRRDYGKSGELMKGMLYNFHSLPFGVVYTAQERQISASGGFDEDEDIEESEVRYVPDLPNAVRNAVNGIVDVIGRIYTVRVDHPKKADTQVVVRRLWIGPSDQLDTGGRKQFGMMPDYIKGPTIPKLIETLKGKK